ncbi:MAG TPA: hypothetical protein VMT35_14675 [Ignavibacteriaceae bacterium]|nr:hypothetical protein [Ignavibacteriaceae bacterium]
MSINDPKIPVPIRLNCWKHHTGYIKLRINKADNIDHFNSIIKEMLCIGNSQMDLYTGHLSPAEISKYIREFLNEKNISSFQAYLKWIHDEEKDYKMINLKDNSSWILRVGNENERYVHIHPGRYSEDSIRVKAAALKTAVASLLWKKINNLPELDLETINYVRKNFIEEPPIKAFPRTAERGLRKIISVLDNEVLPDS